MGLTCSCVTQVQRRVLIVGLDGAGKTALLYKLKLGEVIKTLPTGRGKFCSVAPMCAPLRHPWATVVSFPRHPGFNVESFEVNGVLLNIWDVGSLWRTYHQEIAGVIFVVDSNDPERVDSGTFWTPVYGF